LREGNSDRRAAKAVKKFAQNHPHRLKAFAENSKAYVAHMAGDGDFYGNEKSVTMDNGQKVTIALNGKELATIDTLDKEVLDGTFMSVAKLKAFIAKTIEDAKANGVLWSIHLKATMMKISDPIMFGHAFTVFFQEVFDKYADVFAELNVNPNQGMSDLEKKIAGHAKEAEIKAAFQAVVDSDNPKIAMVDSEEAGTVTVTAEDGTTLMSFECEAGDIWRLSRAKDIPIKDWIRLAVERGQIEQVPVIFWLDENRAHDAEMIKKVNAYLPEFDTAGLDIQIMNVTDATRFTNARVREGKNTIAVTGNVLRDHLTDMYPILELGTSAKMLSIVPLLAGGGLYETGAGGSAPKHVDQFLAEGHLRWDSLGEFLALAESLRFIGRKNSDAKLAALTAALDVANEGYLDNNKAPSRKCCEPDNKASHFFVAQYWAKALAEGKDAELAAKFAPVAKELLEKEDTIISELLAAEGKAQDIGGYFKPDDAKAEKAMRPSATLNAIIDAI